MSSSLLKWTSSRSMEREGLWGQAVKVKRYSMVNVKETHTRPWGRTLPFLPAIWSIYYTRTSLWHANFNIKRITQAFTNQRAGEWVLSIFAIRGLCWTFLSFTLGVQTLTLKRGNCSNNIVDSESNTKAFMLYASWHEASLRRYS